MLEYFCRFKAEVLPFLSFITTPLKEKDMIFHVILEHAEDGWIVAEVPALPGCVSQGKDENDALHNIKEAIIAWLWAEDQKAISALPSKQRREPVVVAV
jgi:predicted RNase H-like HicB family nuclease